LKCLQKDPSRRYPSAEELADNLRRFLSHEPIRARAGRMPERSGKWVKRRPVWAVLIGMVVLGSLAALGGGIWSDLRVRSERDRAEHNCQLALRAVDEMLTEVAEEQLAAEPRMERKRRALLERAQAFYEELFRDRKDDPILRRHMGLAHKRVGDI